MSQSDFGTIDTANTDGVDLAALLENFRDAVNSSHSGTSAPSYAVLGTVWLDTSVTPHRLKISDGTDNITMGQLDPTANSWKPWFGTAVAGALAGLSTVTEAYISNLAVTTAKLASGAVTALKIATNAVNSTHIDSTDAANIRTEIGIDDSVASAGQVWVSDGAGGGSFQTLAGNETGDIEPDMRITPKSGWLHMQGQTIGDSGSGAVLQSASYEALFAFFWDNVSDTYAPVSGGRGANAAADWAAGKTIAMIDCRGRSPIGAGLGTGLSNNLDLGETSGEENHTLLEGEIGPHSHGSGTLVTDFSGNHTHTFYSATLGSGTIYGGSKGNTQVNLNTSAAGNHDHELSGDTATAGDADPFNVTHPVFGVNWAVKI